jgi:hypothetical protein
MAVEPGAAGIDPQGRVEHQLCVPAVSLNGDSYRLKQSKRRQRAARAASIPDIPPDE